MRVPWAWKTKRDESTKEPKKPRVCNKRDNRLNHARGACLKPYNAFVKFAYKHGMVRIHQSFGLLHINIFSECAMQKGTRHIKLLIWPVILHASKSQDKPNGSRLNYWTEGLSVVNTTLLIKALCRALNLSMGPSGFAFNFVNPFVANEVLMWQFSGIDSECHFLWESRIHAA